MSAPRRRRLKLHPVRTDIDGNVNGAALSGAFEAPVQAVHVDARGLRPEPTTTDTKIDALWKMFTDFDKGWWLDRKERITRQEETNAHRAAMLDQIQKIADRVGRLEYILIGLGIGLLIAGGLAWLLL